MDTQTVSTNELRTSCVPESGVTAARQICPALNHILELSQGILAINLRTQKDKMVMVEGFKISLIEPEIVWQLLGDCRNCPRYADNLKVPLLGCVGPVLAKEGLEFPYRAPQNYGELLLHNYQSVV